MAREQRRQTLVVAVADGIREVNVTDDANVLDAGTGNGDGSIQTGTGETHSEDSKSQFPTANPSKCAVILQNSQRR